MLPVIVFNKSSFLDNKKEASLINVLKLKMLSLLLIISQNINCYNPEVINISKNILNLIKENDSILNDILTESLRIGLLIDNLLSYRNSLR